MDKWLQQRQQLVTKCKSIIDGAEAANRSLTIAERAELTKNYGDIETLDGQIKQAKADAPLVAAFSQPGRGPETTDDATSEFSGLPRAKSLSGPQVRSLAERLATKSLDKAGGTLGTKSMVLADATDVLVTEMAVQPHRPTGLLDVIPLVRLDTPTFKFIRQTTRANNAAPVAPGALKPTSTLGLVPVESALRVVAHLSEPIDKYLLADVANLAQFVGAELQYGLFEAVEQQVLTGSGVAPQLSGIASVAGVQTQAFDTDIVTTVRAAITKLEALGYVPSAVVLRPEDWEKVELSQTSGSGEYLMAASPVDRAAQRLWGVPVVLSSAPAVGDGMLLAKDSVKLYTDGRVAVEWDASGANFERNEIRLRVESRFESAVTLPLGVVKLGTIAD